MSCVSFLFFSAGCETSSTNQIYNNLVTENLTNYLLQNTLGVVSQVRSIQNIRLEGDIACAEDLNITNRATLNNVVTSNFNAQSAQQFSDKVSAEIDNALDNYSKSISEFLSQAGSNLTYNDIKNNVRRTVQNTLTVQQLNDIANEVSSDQNIVVLRNISARNCNILNEANIASFVQATLDSINTALLQDEFNVGLANNLKNVTINEQTGLAGFISRFGVFIVVGIVIFLIILVVFYFLNRPSGGATAPSIVTKIP